MIEFANKVWLYLLPVVVVLLLVLFHFDGKGRRASISRFASDRLVQGLLQSYSPFRRRLKNAVILLGVIFLFLALGRPQWGYTWTESSSRGIDIVFALDTSRSMLAQDIKPNRLIRAKLAIEDFVNQLEGDRIGLVAFSGSAFLQCPLTLDYDAFFQSLDAVDTNVISAGGTDLAAAINESEAAFSADNNFKIVVLITDGEDLEGSGIAQARKSAEDGVTLYTVGVGTSEGAPIPIPNRAGRIQYVRDENGEIVQSHLEPETLQTIAQVTGGFYVPLGTTGYGCEQVLEAGIGSIPEEEISSQLQRTAIERFQWPLGLALFFFALEPLIGTRRGWKIGRKQLGGGTALLALFVVGFLLPAQPSSAQEIETEESVPAEDAETVEEIEVVEEPPQTAFARAVEQEPLNPIAHFNRGTELYGEEKYARAVESFTDALRLARDFQFQADAFYNLGNTHYRQGLLSLADASPAKTTEAGIEVSSKNITPMNFGENLLDMAKAQPPEQQQLQQAISALEERKSATASSIETLSAALENESSVQKLWQRSLNDFESALELSPGHQDARHNLDFVKNQTAGLTTEIKRQQNLKQDQERQLPEIERLIEELKKLLEQQHQEQEQQQDQQQNQQHQEQEQQQDQQQNQQQQDQQQENGGQQQEQPSNGEQQDQNSGQQNEQPQDRSSSNEDPAEQTDQSETESQQQSDENSSEQSESEESTPESEDESDSEESEDGESGESEGQEQETTSQNQDDPQNQDEGGAEGEQDESRAGEEEESPMQLSEEQADEIADNLAAAASEGDVESSGENGEEVVIGVMSTDDAARLLDSLKRSERKLPFAGSGSEGSPNRDNRKNW